MSKCPSDSTKCAPGYYYIGGLLPCSSCPVNQYQDTCNGTASCKVCPSNSTTRAATKSTTCTCNAGYTQSGSGSGLVCTACSAGYYSSTVGGTSCSQCSAGQYSAAGATACSSCPANSSSSAGASTCTCYGGYGQSGSGPGLSCTQCSAGQYSAAGSACSQCSAGQYSAAGASSCSTCPSNSSSVAGSSTCTCNSGYSQSGSGSGLICTQCSSGYVSAAGSASCTQCASGTYAIPGSSSCSTCPSNSSSVAGSSTCTCNSGYSQSGSGSGLICTQCSANTYVNGTTCTACPANSTSVAGSSTCTCKAGYSQTGSGSTLVCTICPSNSTSVAGSSVCTCKAGYGQSGSGASLTCTQCSAGYTSTAGSACSQCGLGYYSSVAGAASCIACPSGTYANVLGSTACTRCPAGKYSPSVGATTSSTCLVCPIGTYSMITGATSSSNCLSCPQGTYGDITALASCKSCPSGYYSTNIGATSQTTCLTCPTGQFSASGSSSCITCPPGLYSTTTGASSSASCSLCPAGTYSMSGTTCLPCDPGTYSTRGMSYCGSGCPIGTFIQGSACIRCPAGTFSNTTNSTACTACLTGTYSLPGSSQCNSICPPGAYAQTGTSNCNTCPAGTYYIGKGATLVSNCMTCPAGTFSVIGSPTCTKCPPGTSFAGSQGTTSSVCTSCPAGTYSNNFGSTTCTACPTQTSSTTNSTFCYRATGGIIADGGFYITHTFQTADTFVTLGNIDIYDEIITTPTNVYSKGPRSLVAASYAIDPFGVDTSTILNRGTVYTTNFGIFMSGLNQYIIVYLKTPCPVATPKWDSINNLCVSVCPLTSNISNTCTYCPVFTQLRSIPLSGSAFCEAGFTLSGTTCTKTALTCPDSTWSLSGSLCTKTQLVCSNTNAVIMPQNYCLFSNGVSEALISNTLTLSATSNVISKSAYGACVTSCPIGSYSNVIQCTTCPGIQTTLSTGSSNVNACICPIGTYGLNGSGVCTSCGTNQTSPIGTQTQSGCVLFCPVGSYANGNTCTICPYGTSPAGSTTVSACACTSGTYLNNGTCVAQCPPGMYGDVATKTCIQCPGTQTSNTGTVGITGCQCPDGTGGNNGTGICTQCTGGQVSNVTNLTCQDNSWTLTGNVCSKVSSYICPGLSYDDIISAGQLLEPSQINIGYTTRTFTNQPTGLLTTSTFTFSLDIQIETSSTTWRDILQNIPGSTWPIDNTDKRKPLLSISGDDQGASTRKIWFMYSTNPGGPQADFNLGIGSTNFQFTPGAWFNCTCTVDGTNKQIKMYINGQKQSEVISLQSTFTNPTASPTFTWRPWNANNNGYINVKNVYWWNQVLSNDEIALLNGLVVSNANYKTGNTCYSTVYTCPSPSCTVKNYICPSGYTRNASICLNPGQPMKEAGVICSCPTGSYNCPSNTTLIPGTSICQANTPTSYSCPYGGSNYSVGPDGSVTAVTPWILEGTRCKRYSCTGTAADAPIFFTGTTCFSNIAPMSCPRGYFYRNVCNIYGACREYCENSSNPSLISNVIYNHNQLSTTVLNDNIANGTYDQVPATPIYQDQVSTSNILTRVNAFISGIQTISADVNISTTGKQCICPSSQYWDFKVKQCVIQCPAATYADQPTKTCQPCPVNKTSFPGSTNLSNCVCSYMSPYWTGFSCMQELNPTEIVTGSGFVTRYDNGLVVHEFTTSTNFTILRSVLTSFFLVGGGAGSQNPDGQGAPGGRVAKYYNYLPVGQYTVSIGAGGQARIWSGGDGQSTTLTGPGVNFTASGGISAYGPVSALQFIIMLWRDRYYYCPIN